MEIENLINHLESQLYHQQNDNSTIVTVVISKKHHKFWQYVRENNLRLYTFSIALDQNTTTVVKQNRRKYIFINIFVSVYCFKV
jgi:hypothetical protein